MTIHDNTANEIIITQVRLSMFRLIVEGGTDTARRIAVLFDIEYDEFVEEHHTELVMAKLKYNDKD